MDLKCGTDGLGFGNGRNQCVSGWMYVAVCIWFQDGGIKLVMPGFKQFCGWLEINGNSRVMSFVLKQCTGIVVQE